MNHKMCLRLTRFTLPWQPVQVIFREGCWRLELHRETEPLPGCARALELKGRLRASVCADISGSCRTRAHGVCLAVGDLVGQKDACAAAPVRTPPECYRLAQAAG